MKCLIIALLITLTGCVSVASTYTPEGTMGHSISCNGTANNWGACEQKAGELCGARGYKVFSKAGDSGLVATPYMLGSKISRSMLIACK